MYIIQYNNIYISKIWKLQCRPCSTSIMHLLTGRLLCFSNYLFFNGPKPRGEIKSKKASNQVSVRGPVLAQRGGYMVFAFRFYYCILLGERALIFDSLILEGSVYLPNNIFYTKHIPSNCILFACLLRQSSPQNT